MRRNCDNRRDNRGNGNCADRPSSHPKVLQACLMHRRWRHHDGLESRWRQWRLICRVEVKILLVCVELYGLRLSICLTLLQIGRRVGCKPLRFMPQMPFDFRNLFKTPVGLVLMLLVPDPRWRIHKLAITIIVDWGTHDNLPSTPRMMRCPRFHARDLVLIAREQRSKGVCSTAQLLLALLKALVFRPDNRRVQILWSVPKYCFWHFVCSKGGDEKRC